MAKTREDLRKKLAERKAKYSEANKSLNKSKWGYSTSDEKKHFKRNSNFLTESALQELSSISDRVVLNEIKCTNLIEGLREHAVRRSFSINS